ncbi:MAG: HNH endonuclease signature motif containing protein [Dehalococcoidia bacterium]
MYRPYSFKHHSRPVKERKIMQAYREEHPVCEACQQAPSTCTHHIVTEKSGGPTEDWNFLALCFFCHTPGVHQLGNRRFIERYPHIGPKIVAARLRMGRNTK